MPRPQLAIGEYGMINTTKHGAVWVALARYRDNDGITRRVKAQAKSKSAAEAGLRAKFKERNRTGAGLTNDSRIKDLAERYYAAKQADGLAANTLYNMRRAIDNHIVPKFGNLRIREATPQRLQETFAAITADHGPGTALTVRSTLSGMFALAGRWGAAPSNPVQHTPVPKTGGKAIRALTPDDLIRMRTHAAAFIRPLTYDERLVRANGDKARMGGKNRGTVLLDLIDFLLSTGARAAEGPGTEWADVHLDDEVPWVMIRQQVIRVIGDGLRQTETKEGDTRRLRLPRFAVDMLRRRQSAAVGALVFPSERGGLLDPRNVSTVWRNTFKGTEWDWVTAKTLRKTVATLVDAELGSKVAAKQLGHASDSMTRKFYIAESLSPLDTGEALELFEVRGTQTGRLELLPPDKVQPA